MATSTVRPDSLLDELDGFSHAVVAFVDDQGFPLNVPARFETDRAKGVVRLDVPAAGLPGDGDEVTVTFSSVHPQPGVGYDQRRYITVWGGLQRREGTVELEPRRTHGWDEERMPFFELCERSVPRALAYMQSLEDERGVPVRPRLSRGWLFFATTRVPFLSATLVPVLLGMMVARSHGASAWWYALLALLGASAIHLGLNVANDVFDSESGTDAANVTPTPFSGGSRVVQYGLVSLASMRRLAYGLYGIGIAVGLVLAATRGWDLLWVGLAGVLISWFYTAPPLRLVHRGVGDIATAIGFGPIVVLGTEFVVAREFTGEALYASIPVGILCALILYVNQVPDRFADATAGKRTLAVRWSPEAVTLGYAASAAIALLMVPVGVAVGVLPAGTLLALLATPLAVQVWKGLREHYDSPYGLMGTMGRNIGLHGLVGLGLVAGYVIDIVF